MTQPEARGEPPAAPLVPVHADTAVVVVHGIGDQLRGATLLEWAEPLTRRLDTISRRRGLAGATVRYVTLLDEAPSQVWIEVQTAPGTTRTIAFLEARWARSFLTVTPTSVVGWSVRFVWRAGRSAAGQIWRAARTFLGVTPTAVPQRLEAAPPASPPAPTDEPGGPAGTYLDSVLDTHTPTLMALTYAVLALMATALGLLGLLAAALVGWVVPPVAVVALVVLALATRVPLLSRWAKPVVTAMVTSLGDAAVWTTTPVRAAAMRDVVRERVREARTVADRVAVVAHSQGAAVSAAAVLEEPGATPVELLVTVGGANTLLREPAWALGEERPLAVLEAWARRPAMRWVNIVALLDPVPSGPLGGSRRAVRARWREIADSAETLAAEHRRLVASAFPGTGALPRTPGLVARLFFQGPQPESAIGRALRQAAGRPEPASSGPADEPVAPSVSAAEVNRLLDEAYASLGQGEGPVGPEEHVVDNRLSVTTDHVTYTQNVVQVIDPIARLVAEPESFDPLAAAASPEVRRHVSAVTGLLLARFVCALLAVLATPFVMRLLDRAGWLDAAIAGASSARGTVRRLAAFIVDHGLAAAVFSAVVALVLFTASYLPVRTAWVWYERVIAWGRERWYDAVAPGAFYGAFALVVAALLVLAGAHADVTWDVGMLPVVAAVTGAVLLVPSFRVRLLILPARRVSGVSARPRPATGGTAAGRRRAARSEPT